ncbi:4-(cytidine 5'-diphospho)-2-C-methyl-D-erythritol kinase [Hansschlegelia sp. KR7-227]|uniref:4-(cytidine 5'-diphospho)-2-C-methyl-D-erythritol kinase n=1 Tax=Hansschlegelia sp. KR7-227 TaxID=3400914 RepID=UPI003C115CFF
MTLRQRAPAKVNLTLRVLGRRADGYHELDSLVAFAGCAADAVSLAPGPRLELARVDGPFADAAGPQRDNLVLKAARAAAERIEGLTLGAFTLTKRIPVAAGLGGGSADAGAALRLIAEANGLAPDDPRLAEAAAATGSDVPACLVSRACLMTGRGEGIAPFDLPPLAAVLANPMKGLSTAAVFRALGLAPDATFHAEAFPGGANGAGGGVFDGRNDLEPPARALMPEIAEGIAALAAAEGCRLARMSGSGATVFGLFDGQRQARAAARALKRALPGWWLRATMLR